MMDENATNFQPPFKIGGVSGPRKDPNTINQAYKQLGNLQDLKKETQDKL